MATFLNGVNLQGLTNGAIAFTQPSGTVISGYVSPNLQGLDIKHDGTIDRVPNQAGQTASLMVTDEWLELTFDYFPQGSSAANAKKSAILPELLSKAAITGLPIFQIGAFADALNTDGASTQPWVYEGGGGYSGKAKEKWDGKITLRRYVAIASGATYVTV